MSDAETLAALMEIANELAALSLDLGIEPPEPGEDVESAAEYADGLAEVIRHMRHGLNG